MQKSTFWYLLLQYPRCLLAGLRKEEKIKESVPSECLILRGSGWRAKSLHLSVCASLKTKRKLHTNTGPLGQPEDPFPRHPPPPPTLATAPSASSTKISIQIRRATRSEARAASSKTSVCLCFLCLPASSALYNTQNGTSTQKSTVHIIRSITVVAHPCSNQSCLFSSLWVRMISISVGLAALPRTCMRTYVCILRILPGR